MGVQKPRWMLTLAVMLTVLLGPSVVAPMSANAAPVVNSSSADAVRAAYREYRQLVTTLPGSTGNTITCQPGTTTPAYQNSILRRVNIMRGLAGQEPVTFSAAMNADAQAAALIMSANDMLNHYPDSTDKCHTVAGERGAGASNLFLAFGYDPYLGDPPDPVAMYMDDYGTHNIEVGHRWWILRPEARTMGTGTVVRQAFNFANALYVVDGTPSAVTPQLVTWPSKGFFPSQFMPTSNRWSIQLSAGGSLASASVKVTGPSGAVTTKVIHRAGDRLVWEVPTLPRVTGQASARYTVTVTGIVGTSSSYSYNVDVIDGSWVNVYTTPGEHDVNGRRWKTRCEMYSQTVERCFTDIWATQVRSVGGRYVQSNGWVFNNLTYKPSPRAQWSKNPLGGFGIVGDQREWVEPKDGRRWRVECDTAVSGRNGCRAYTWSTVIEAVPGGGFRTVQKYVFNNIVIFS